MLVFLYLCKMERADPLWHLLDNVAMALQIKQKTQYFKSSLSGSKGFDYQWPRAWNLQS